MPLISAANSIHTDKVLATLATEYMPRGFIGRQLVTKVPTNGEKSGTFRTRNKDNMLREQNVEIGELGMPAEVEAGYGSASYACKNYSAMAKVPVDVASQADIPLNMRVDGVKIAKMRCLMAQERRIATLLTTTSSYASGNFATLSGTSQWSDYSNSDPIGDVDTYTDAIFASPDALMVAWMGRSVWLKLKEHPQILERIKFGGSVDSPAKIGNNDRGRRAVADVLGVDLLLVGEARSTATNPGQTAAYSRMWGKDFGVLAVEPGQSTMFLGFAALFEYQAEQVDEVFEPLPGLKGVDVVKVAHSVDEIIAASDAGMVLKAVVA